MKLLNSLLKIIILQLMTDDLLIVLHKVSKEYQVIHVTMWSYEIVD